MTNSSVFRFSHHSIFLANTSNRTDVREPRRAVSIGELVFCDKASRNSFRVESARELAKYLPQIEKTCDAFLFRAEGRLFCSGGNLKDHVTQGRTGGKAANRTITSTLAKLSALKIPTVAIVEGDVLGGGIELLSAFDVVMSTPQALFGLWQRRMGLAFGWGGGARLARRMPRASLSRLALESRPLTAIEALQSGLVDSISSPWAIQMEAWAEALRLASLPKISIHALKMLRAVPLVEARREQLAFEKLWYGPIHRSRIENFSQS